MKLEARKYVVYYEGLNANEVVPPVEIAITDAKTGSLVAITPYGGSLTYSVSNHEGSALGTVTPAHAGAYALHTESNVGRAARTWRSGAASRGRSCAGSSAHS